MSFIDNLFEDRKKGIEYQELFKQGQINKVIAIIESAKKSQLKRITALEQIATAFIELDKQAKDLNEQLESAKEDIRDVMDQYFDAEDKLITRAIQLETVTIKTSKMIETGGYENFNVDKFIEGILQLAPQLTRQIIKLKNECTTTTEIVQGKTRVFVEPTTESFLGDMWNKIKNKITSYYNSFKNWLSNYDKQFNELEQEINETLYNK